jgi:hypothetical protein
MTNSRPFRAQNAFGQIEIFGRLVVTPLKHCRIGVVAKKEVGVPDL